MEVIYEKYKNARISLQRKKKIINPFMFRCHIGTSSILAAIPMAAWRICLQNAIIPPGNVS